MKKMLPISVWVCLSACTVKISESTLSSQVNGKELKIVSTAQESGTLDTSEKGFTAKLGDHAIRSDSFQDHGTVEVDGIRYSLPEFRKLTITLDADQIRVIADDRALSPQS